MATRNAKRIDSRTLMPANDFATALRALAASEDNHDCGGDYRDQELQDMDE